MIKGRRIFFLICSREKSKEAKKEHTSSFEGRRVMPMDSKAARRAGLE